MAPETVSREAKVSGWIVLHTLFGTSLQLGCLLGSVPAGP